LSYCPPPLCLPFDGHAGAEAPKQGDPASHTLPVATNRDALPQWQPLAPLRVRYSADGLVRCRSCARARDLPGKHITARPLAAHAAGANARCIADGSGHGFPLLRGQRRPIPATGCAGTASAQREDALGKLTTAPATERAGRLLCSHATHSRRPRRPPPPLSRAPPGAEGWGCSRTAPQAQTSSLRGALARSYRPHGAPVSASAASLGHCCIVRAASAPLPKDRTVARARRGAHRASRPPAPPRAPRAHPNRGASCY